MCTPGHLPSEGDSGLALGSRRQGLGPALVPVNRMSDSAFLNLGFLGWKVERGVMGLPTDVSVRLSTVVGTKGLKGAVNAMSAHPNHPSS